MSFMFWTHLEAAVEWAGTRIEISEGWSSQDDPQSGKEKNK